MATLAEVARKAGVSTSVASKVLNKSATPISVSPATRARIQDAAADLDYVPDARARALRQQQSSVLGILTGSLNGVLRPQFVHHLSGGLIARRKEFLLGVHRHDPEVVRDYVRTFRSHRTFAVLILGEEDFLTDSTRELLQEGVGECGPWIVVAFTPRVNPVPAVTIDLPWVMKELGRMLLADRRDKVFLISRAADHSNAVFAETLRKSIEMPTEVLIERTDEPLSHAENAIAMLLERCRGQRAAVVTETDNEAALVAKGLLQAGVSVPKEIAVVGYGGLQVSWCSTPSISAFDVMGAVPDMARKTMELLDEVIAGRELAPEDHTFRPRFVVRDSFRPPESATS